MSDAAKILRGASGHAILPRVASSFGNVPALRCGMIPASLTFFRRTCLTSELFLNFVLYHFNLFAPRGLQKIISRYIQEKMVFCCTIPVTGSDTRRLCILPQPGSFSLTRCYLSLTHTPTSDLRVD